MATDQVINLSKKLTPEQIANGSVHLKDININDVRMPKSEQMQSFFKQINVDEKLKTRLLDFEDSLNNIADQSIKKAIIRELDKMSQNGKLDLKTFGKLEQLTDAVNAFNNNYSAYTSKDYDGLSAMARLNKFTKSELSMDVSGVLSSEVPNALGGVRNKKLKLDLKLENRYYPMRQYLKKYPNSGVSNYLYERYYLHSLGQMHLKPEIIQKCKNLNNEYGVKVMISADYSNADEVFDYLNTEFKKWKNASGGNAKLPPVIDFSSAKANWYDSLSANGMGASGGYSEPSFNGSLAFPRMDKRTLAHSLRHELTHTNDLKQGVGISSKYNLDEIMPKKTVVKKGRTIKLPDFENCKYTDEFRRAGIEEGHIPYAYNNPQEFIAVASQGNLEAYSPEFRQVLIDFGMPEWMFKFPEIN